MEKLSKCMIKMDGGLGNGAIAGVRGKMPVE
jgi:hypothetical protein